ncbi:retrovirus-related pol polyprotein from transposon TNT 1-94 [Tanacetum coccineum]
MGDENSNQPRTLGDYSRPSHEGYRNAIELPEGAKVSPLRSDTIRLVQNGCAFHRLMSKDPIQHLKDFLKIVDSIDLNSATRNTTRLSLFCFTLRDQAINWLDRLPTGSISTWDDLTTRFLGQFFPPERTAKLRNDILMFQQHQVQIFYDHVNYTTQMAIDDAAGSQVKDNKIDLLVQQYEQFVIFEDESIDSAFARFNTIITSLKALDEGYSSKNYVRKFLRALHPKWRAKVTAIEESKDLTSLSLDELIGNLKVHKMIIKKDSKIVKAKVERKSLALKAKKESSDEECSTSESEDEEYAMAVREFKKLFKRRVIENALDAATRIILLENVQNHRKTRTKEHLSEVLEVSGEEDDKKVYNETCLVAQALSEICLGVDLEPDEWIKDSGCSKHMTGNRKLFLSYKAYNGGQICDHKCRVTFYEHDSEITKDGKVIGRGIRKKGLYVMKLGNEPKDKICQATIDENSTLWHKRLGHANIRLIQSLASKKLFKNLPKLKFDQYFCDACKIGKQALLEWRRMREKLKRGE